MDEVTTGVLAFRLLVTAVAVVGPTLLYLGLWRFLSWLRDDELIDQLAAKGVFDESDTIEPAHAAPVDGLASASEPTESDDDPR
ncbi:MAG: hypothetical protein PPP55_09085 [Halorubrum sp.]